MFLKRARTKSLSGILVNTLNWKPERIGKLQEIQDSLWQWGKELEDPQGAVWWREHSCVFWQSHVNVHASVEEEKLYGKIATLLQSFALSCVHYFTVAKKIMEGAVTVWLNSPHRE